LAVRLGAEEKPLPYATHGPPYVSTGLAAAEARLKMALANGGPDDSFVAIFETVMWLVVMDERFRKVHRYLLWKEGEAHDVLEGCWHAWNLPKHCRLDKIVDVTPGAQWPLSWDVGWGEVRWKAFDDLPLMASRYREEKHYPERVDCYRRALQGNPVRLTIPVAIDKVQGWLLSSER
jgi:hypothetical protein